MRTASPGVPISWPLGGETPPADYLSWMGPNSVSDYASHYWISYNERPAYAWSLGVQEGSYWMTQEFYSRQQYLMLDRPQLLEISMAGPTYIKETAGAAYYSPPLDQLQYPATLGPAAVSEMMTAAALGVAGERLYVFEHPSQEASRASTPVGSAMSTGSNPVSSDRVMSDTWAGIENGARALTQVLTPFLFQLESDSPGFGANIVTTVRRGEAGNLLLIVNNNDWARELTVDLTSYGSISNAYRYVVGAYGTQLTKLHGEAEDDISLGPGQSVAYLFPSDEGLEAIDNALQAHK